MFVNGQSQKHEASASQGGVLMDLQHIAQELAEEFAPLVIGQSGTTKTFTAEQASALYHILVSFGYNDECKGLDIKLPFELIDIKKEVL